jgi:hypothetical protein
VTLVVGNVFQKMKLYQLLFVGPNIGNQLYEGSCKVTYITIFTEKDVLNEFLEYACLIGLLLYSIWSRLWLSLKALVV